MSFFQSVISEGIAVNLRELLIEKPRFFINYKVAVRSPLAEVPIGGGG